MNGERKIEHYSSSHKILLVGEGDFSFAKCLAKAFGTALNITATSLDSKESLMAKYGGAMANLTELKDMGCTIIHQVDAHAMKYHPELEFKLFDRIVFNFPHAGFIYKEHNVEMIRLHRELVRGFFNNARYMLRGMGQVHVTHKTAHPFRAWNIEDLAKEESLYLCNEWTFRISSYPGYENKRGQGSKSDDSFPVGECSTFVFAVI